MGSIFLGLRHMNINHQRLAKPAEVVAGEVVYAALGPEKQYFLRFRDGDTCWSLWSVLG